MRRKVFVGVSFFASVMCSFYILTYIIKETDQEKFLFGYMLLAGCIFGLCMWLYEWARVRDERKKRIERRKKQNEKTIKCTK